MKKSQSLVEKKVELCLHYKTTPLPLHSPLDTVISFPVQFAHRSYGALKVQREVGSLHLPLPLDVLYLLAQICGCLLYSWEVTALLQGQDVEQEQRICSSLTEQERVVLLLMGHGKTKDEVAQTLSISVRTVSTHRQNIYQKLGVHSERDALLVAYHQGLFSPLEELEL